MSDIKTASEQPDTVKDFTRADIIEDFNFLIKTLEDVHSDLYAIAKVSDIRTKCEQARNSFKDNMTLTDFYRVIGCIVPLFKDGHTYINYGTFLNINDPVYLPVRLAYSGEDVIIISDITNTFNINDVVSSINDVPIEEIISVLKKYISVLKKYISAEKEVFQNVQLITNFSLMLSIITDIQSPFKIKVKRNNKLHTRTLSGFTYADLMSNEQTKSSNTNTKVRSFEIKEDYGLLTIGSFGYYGKEGEEFIKFIDDVFAELKSININKNKKSKIAVK